jgi:hypothetical protein
VLGSLSFIPVNVCACRRVHVCENNLATDLEQGWDGPGETFRTLEQAWDGHGCVGTGLALAWNGLEEASNKLGTKLAKIGFTSGTPNMLEHGSEHVRTPIIIRPRSCACSLKLDHWAAEVHPHVPWASTGSTRVMGIHIMIQRGAGPQKIGLRAQDPKGILLFCFFSLTSAVQNIPDPFLFL